MVLMVMSKVLVSDRKSPITTMTVNAMINTAISSTGMTRTTKAPGTGQKETISDT